MNLIHKIEVWGDTHHPKFLDVIRVALGVFLLMKGIAFMENSTSLKTLIEDQNAVFFSPAVLMFLVYYVTFAHLVGGAMVALGTFTRFASILQIPIVLAAVFLTGFFISPVNYMLWPSIAALVLLVLFTVIGSGPLSLDRFVTYIESDEV
jgi:putative oxidoreductase